VELPGVLEGAPPSQATNGFAPVSPGSREPTIYGPLKIRVDMHCTAMYTMVDET
jgi:hypothetical protein